MNLTNSQSESVDKLFELFKSGETNCSFKAPTGSGKTFMASSLISKIFEFSNLTNKKLIIVFATVSSAELPRQLSEKLNEYKQYHNFSNYTVEYISSPSNSKSQLKNIEDVKDFKIKENNVYVFGTSSFGKNTLFYQNNTLKNFYTNCKSSGYEVVFIRDEAHIGKKEKLSKQDLITFDEITRSNSSFTIEMTATPKTRLNLVELTNDELVNDEVNLLKSKMHKTSLIGEISNEDIIDEAIEKFKEIKKQYSRISENSIRPALLIQVMNESDYEKDPIKHDLFKEQMAMLEKKLNDASLIYLKYMNEKKVFGSTVEATLKYASKNDSLIDVILFKVGPATGWDIPRACMILQLRNVSSESLNTQTIGRIMRNPMPNLEFNSVTDNYYVYSSFQTPTRESAVYQLKDKFKDKLLISGNIDKTSSLIQENLDNYVNQVKDLINSVTFKNLVNDFRIDQIIYDEINYGSATIINRIPNFVKLKIYNSQIHNENNKKLYYDLFYEDLKSFSIKYDTNFEIIKYIFYSLNGKILEIKQRTSDWFKSEDPYTIDKKAPLLSNYQLWIDNNDPKKVDIKSIENYGYYQVTNDTDIQYLDSKPELKFFNSFMSILTTENKNNIKFFAKMPTLGSKVYFEYYSKISGKISKSYMDFAIQYKESVIMVEVKSKDKDYNEEKTKELQVAYEKYMDKFSDENIHLLICKYDEELDYLPISMRIDGEWNNEVSFADAFMNLFK